MAERIPADAFVASPLNLTASNRRDEVMAMIDADCKHLKEMCWQMRKVYGEFQGARDQYERDIINGAKPNIDDLIAKNTKSAGLEKDIYFLKDKIEKDLAEWNFGKDVRDRIYVEHTAEGLPFSVNRSNKRPLWGI